MRCQLVQKACSHIFHYDLDPLMSSCSKTISLRSISCELMAALSCKRVYEWLRLLLDQQAAWSLCHMSVPCACCMVCARVTNRVTNRALQKHMAKLRIKKLLFAAACRRTLSPLLLGICHTFLKGGMAQSERTSGHWADVVSTEVAQADAPGCIDRCHYRVSEI